ncbi:MAG: hypothetical protein QOJ23_5967 [Actinomycetota bacterium]|jgi:hypothetical protein|nr:hypothetical protein [Actinomycetota bacterium]MDQ1498272.1 hypothetical protein [Actinomycetota bacterium]
MTVDIDLEELEDILAEVQQGLADVRALERRVDVLEAAMA